MNQKQQLFGDADRAPVLARDRVEIDVFSLARDLVTSRQNVSPKRLVEPGPSAPSTLTRCG